ncbi:DUF1549 domain-containing protein [Brevifollis gellanilyticus]|uniref:Cytochrome c n=1 Tax=Brevifollis gellanilyticus TaxID=748831 RepID=A0A512MCN9_9BACT|nr:DUF1549 domain-containing protein [Brevifollis gellanilyticus]GEP44503.1 hypothetical protein BGE01nite_37940 [Brevifollis gellanilyticus]
MMRSLLIFLLAAKTAGAAQDAPDFEKEVLPVLYHHCFSCHSEKQSKPKGGLLLDSVTGIQAGDVLVPGKPEASELLTRATLPINDEDVMPPLKGGAQPLSEADREVLRRWIASGASFGKWQKFDHRGPVMEISKAPTVVSELAVKIDGLVEEHHQKRGTHLNAPVSDEVFLRRVYLDVMGRIPSLEESRRFLDNKAGDKRSRLIDELINSQGYESHLFNWKADQLRLLTQGLPGQPGWLYDEWVKEAIHTSMPYDEYVRRLITANGYLWENGAVGFYVRDMGMPLDHMSNLTRVFLGTRIECAQCHDHPLQPVTQKDFYQMAAFTFGVTNMCSSAGFSEKNVKQWPEVKAKLDSMKADTALRQGVSRTIATLKRLTTDTGKSITFPETYEYDKTLRKKPVEARTLFGDEAPATEGDRREAFAAWLTSPRNPRFAVNIANRLWKRVMGVGLIEPVDSLSVLPAKEHAALMDILAQAMIQMKFDERSFTAALLNTRLYQSAAVRETPQPGVAFDLRGPQLRRLSAEQIWDSCLTLIVQDLDERKSLRRTDGSEIDPERLRKLSRMCAGEIIERAKDEMEYRKRNREFQLRLVEQSKERQAARDAGDEAKVKQLQSEHARENAEFFSPRLKAMQMGHGYVAKETDPRWKHLTFGMVRASEIPLPLALGHFLRQFGQSDRREIDAFNRDPNTTHSLALMNGELTGEILAKDSWLQRSLAASKANAQERVRLLYQAVLVREPADDEVAELAKLTQGSADPERDILWALLNSPEFLFLQ